MTQEEKFKEAKRLYQTANADQKYVLESLFPELKESEDERTWIINYLSNRILNSTIIAEKENLKKAIAWVEKQGEQTPAWSEEDEKMIQDIINDIAIAQEQVYCKSRCEDEINWLKSLKERYTWKPSDYELEVLKLAAEKDGTCLMGLYEQLKKLREE